jgi:hypothetical protein
MRFKIGYNNVYFYVGQEELWWAWKEDFKNLIVIQ